MFALAGYMTSLASSVWQGDLKTEPAAQRVLIKINYDLKRLRKEF